MKKLVLLILVAGFLVACEDYDAKSTTGLRRAQAEVVPQSNGLSVEQENIKRRIEQENVPGSIKHLYILSAYSGQVMFHFTVKGKVTSSGKRLSPYTVNDGSAFKVDFGDSLSRYTPEVLQDDGTYGDSIPYLYFWDVEQDGYNQIYVTSGLLYIIREFPLAGTKSVTLNISK
jgi:hypothetical protein